MASLFSLNDSTAVISSCGLYRYRLTRTWGDAMPMCFIMLNPSTADASEDDPTIRRCIGFARREGCGGIVAVNLFAFRATDPAKVWTALDPVGPDNNQHIIAAVQECNLVVAAWGVSGEANGRDKTVRKLIWPVVPACLGTTKAGHPRHPLYVKADQPLIRMEGI